MIKEFLSKCRTQTYAAGVEGEKINCGTKYLITEGDLKSARTKPKENLK